MLTGWRSLRVLSLGSVTWFLCVGLGWPLLAYAVAALPLRDLPLGVGLGLLLCVVLATAAELRPVMASDSHDPYGVSLSTAFVGAALLVWGLWPAVVVMTLAAAVAHAKDREPVWKLLFNVGQYNLSLAAAAATLWFSGVHASMAAPFTDLSGAELVPILASWVAYFAVNNALVSGALAGRLADFGRAFRTDIGYYAGTTFAVLALSPLMIVLSVTSLALLPLLALPVALVYRTAQMSLSTEHQAQHDTLTGLPNRKLMAQRLDAALAEARRRGTSCALLLLDLDRFKDVNDTLGHQAGDRLLDTLAHRLEEAVRAQDTVARLGGDEFAVILPDVGVETGDVDAVTEIAERLRSACATPVPMDGLLLDVDASVGIARYPEHGRTAQELLRSADVAMYDAKRSRRGVATYAADRDGNSTDRLSLMGELRAALDAGGADLTVHYQPKVALCGDVEQAQVIGVEALVRWTHPQRGDVPPAEFIPLAERSGLMPVLTEHVLTRALAQARSWHASGLFVPIAVNVSLVDLTGRRLLDTVTCELAQHPLPPGTLQLEVTERLVAEDTDELAEVLRELAALGVVLSLDDFGTGYSSLVRLRALPVREMKIDQSFVSGVGGVTTDDVLVRAIVDLGHALGVPVVAEGVETLQQWQMLADMGCDAVQGWLVAPAMPGPVATEWLLARRAGQTATGSLDHCLAGRTLG